MSLQAMSEPSADLSLSQIVDATVQLLDERGVAGFTMRALGERLGRSAMAAYRHVSDRDTLFELAAEAIAQHGWQTAWRPHGWSTLSMNRRPHLERDRLELMKQTFRDAGFDEDDIVRALIAHWSFVIGTLHFLKRVSSQGSTLDADEVFEFNLGAWVLGLEAKAAGRPPGDVRHT